MMRRLPLLLVLTICCDAAFAQQEDTEYLRAQVELLKLQVQELERSIARLEARQDTQQAEPRQDRQQAAEAPVPAPVPQDEPADSRLSFEADFRYRHEWIELEPEGAPASRRNRARIRARGELTARVTDTVDIGFGVASGDEDPISANQTLGQQSSTKDWRLDQAYFDWEALDGLHWLGGKYKNPIRRAGGHGLLWDGDLRPEGLSIVYDSGRFFGTAGFNYIDSDTRGPLGDRYGYRNFQLGYRLDTGANWQLVVGAGYYDFDTEREPTLIPGIAFNNTIGPDGRLAYDYDEKEFFAEFQLDLPGYEFSTFVDYVENIEIDEQNQGYAFGMSFGSTRGARDWEISYAYQDLEADAVFGAYTDSDFAGGGTDNRGSVISAAYAFTPQVKIELTHFDNERTVFGSEVPVDFRRTFLDLVFDY